MLALVVVFAAGCSGGTDSELEGKYVVTFQLNGGVLDYQTSSSKTKINFAYEPETYIVSPENIPGYDLYRNGYNFTGWYKSESCNPSDKWDFDREVISTETMTLYAGWEKAVKHTFTVSYTDDSGKVVSLYQYKDMAGKVFEDWRDAADDRKGYTPIAYYSDKELTTPWDFDYVHPGGDADLDIPVYVKYIVGDWELVSDFTQLKSAIRGGDNVYLTQNIDCGGGELTFTGRYGGVIEGNGYTVNNFTVTARNSSLTIKRSAIFETLTSSAEIRNVTFSAVQYVVKVTGSADMDIQAAAIAYSAEDGAKITNVTVSGEFKTNYTGELPDVEAAVFEPSAETKIDGFTADITVVTEQA